jgi:hypothetical protein
MVDERIDRLGAADLVRNRAPRAATPTCAASASRSAAAAFPRSSGPDALVADLRALARELRGSEGW